jgi:hypothetical protein
VGRFYREPFAYPRLNEENVAGTPKDAHVAGRSAGPPRARDAGRLYRTIRVEFMPSRSCVGRLHHRR